MSKTRETIELTKGQKTLTSLKQMISLRELGLALFIIVLSLAIQARNPVFLTISNLRSLMVNTSILAIMAVGMMMVLITRGIDLSIGSIMAFTGMVAAMTVMQNPTMHPFLALLIGTTAGMAIGGLTGVLVSFYGILPIIATLGMMNVVRGMTYVVSGGRWISSHQMSNQFKGIATGTFLGVNNLIWVAIWVFVLAAIFLNHTKVGRQIYAVGSNPEAAEISGLPKRRIILLVYVLMGGLAGLGGVLWVARFASAQGNTAIGYELNVIAACILGGVSISGGVGKITGLLLGTLLLGILNNALPLINVSPFWQMGIQGTIILAAVLTNVIVKRRTDARALSRRPI